MNCTSSSSHSHGNLSSVSLGQFSLHDGYDLCIALDKSLDLNAHETFWQLFMEKEFLRQVINSLSPGYQLLESTAINFKCRNHKRIV